jgi:hypothetical protein
MESSPEFDLAMEKLFTAKWNIPQAASALGFRAAEEDWERLKVIFSEYCKRTPIRYHADASQQPFPPCS